MSARRLGQEGVPPADARRAVGVIAAALAEEGPLTRGELGARLAGHGLRTAGQALPHLLLRAALDGEAVLGPDRDGEPAFVAARDWLGPPPAVDRGAALAELARRYLAGHGPATDADLAAWSGLPRRDARAGLGALAAGEANVGDDGLVDLTGREPPERTGVRLLGAFDPYLLGWRDRAFALDAAHARRVHPGGGIIRATVLVDGAVAGTWRAERRGSRLRVEVDAFPGTELAVPADEEADLARFEGLALG
jgi:winged helix DNA-binding protein